MSNVEFINRIKIVNLAEDIRFLEEISAWHWSEWDKSCGITLEEVIYRNRHSLYSGRIPQTFIAKLNDEVVGTVSLWNNDLKCRQDLTPWLAALYIKKEYRGKGLGTLLQKKCIDAARGLGYEKLYLITEHENYYERTGWKLLELAPVNEPGVRIYEYDL